MPGIASSAGPAGIDSSEGGAGICCNGPGFVATQTWFCKTVKDVGGTTGDTVSAIGRLVTERPSVSVTVQLAVKSP